MVACIKLLDEEGVVLWINGSLNIIAGNVGSLKLPKVPLGEGRRKES
jgi:hypothetical protein